MAADLQPNSHCCDRKRVQYGIYTLLGRRMQSFKTVYFADYPCPPEGRSGLTVPFAATELRLFEAVSRLSSHAIRCAIGHQQFTEVQAAAARTGTTTSGYVKERLRTAINPSDLIGDGFDAAVQSTFVGGRGSPLHDWFPYLEGYSPAFVRTILAAHAPDAIKILDPFCGSGTTALTAASLGLRGTYCEVNPVCRQIIEAKANALRLPSSAKHRVAENLERLAETLAGQVDLSLPAAELRDAFGRAFGVRPFFSDDIFSEVLGLRTLLDGVRQDDTLLAELAEVAVLGCLVQNSLLVRRGDLRFRTEAELRRSKPNLLGDVVRRLRMIASDLLDVENVSGVVELATPDIRDLDPDRHGRFDAIVTSPPYLNGTNYFRNTKIELWFARHLRGKADLRSFRDAAITSGINDVTNSKTSARSLPSSARLKRTLGSLEASAYDQRIPKMVASYFAEMDEAAACLHRVSSPGTCVAIDLGDSCYGDVHVATDIILREFMIQRGFDFLDEVVLRERASRSGRGLRQTLQIFKAS
ncbi:hypothetical protein [Sphingomonas sp. G-3-2-10]|uniref:hypothetical protein n=1 Tax=Sphingomonas sp. G-3-2-10 TaxID=2728838 RepID=UPI00146CC690|nr:hypothetical protein [Sphingomonas sp. G-3-2-10]NML06524.1 hypothetical protein [Sphingomonas sp. G-3-2-10]